MKRSSQRRLSINARLSRAQSVWMATVGRDQKPQLLPVWFIWLEEIFYFVVAQGSEQYENLRHNQQVTVSMPDIKKVIIIEGVAEICDRQTTEEMADYFYNKYEFDYTQDQEFTWYLVAVEPTRILSWGDGFDEEGVVVK